MSDPWQQNEKAEKQEKEEEKQEKNEWQQDRLSTITWAAVLIWAGLVLLADNVDIFLFDETWAVILAGAGVIVLFEALARLAMPEYRRPIGGQLVLAVVLIAVGLGAWLDWAIIWPVALIAIGLSILFRNLGRPGD